jgi:pilus assembly protein FimV
VHQTMLAIQELNPQAFIGGNINRLKSGQVLRLPNEQQITTRSPAEAIAQVAEQNAAWREGRSIAATGSRQLDATKRSVAGAAPAKTESQDSLQLVAADAGKAKAGNDKGADGDSKALGEKLAVTKESLDSTRRENTELKGRMTDLQSQLDKLQRLIQLKDDQLAKLQADLAAKGKVAAPVAAAPAAPVAAPAKAAPVAPAAPAAPAAAAPAPAKEAAPAAPVAPAATPATPATDFNYSEEPAKPAAVQPAPAAEVKKPAPVAAKPVQPVQVAPVAAPVAEPESDSFIGDLLANPLALGLAGGGALLALLVGLMVLSRRNALKEAELQNSLNEHADESLESDLELPESSFDGLDADPVEADLDAEQASAPVTAQTADVLGEADIYIAYGRFNQAAELLQNAINDEPQRSDLRLKLMEVQAELGDRDGFARQERELREIGGVNADLEQINAKYPAMAAAAVVGAAALNMDDELDAFNLDDLELEEPAAQPATGDLDDAFDLSLDELSAELDHGLDAVATPKADDAFAELSLDGDFDLPETAAANTEADDDLGFDLDLDMEEPAATPELSLESADDLADFSLDLESDTLAVAEDDEDFLLDLEDEPAAPAAADELSELSLELPGEAAATEFDLPVDFDLSLAEEEPVAATTDSFAAQLDEVTAQLDDLAVNLQQSDDDVLLDLEAPALGDSLATGLDGDDDFDFLSGTDEAATKLDLARAYIDMGDTEGARDILDEVVAEGNDTQQQEARELLAGLT